jgi:16S rRNA (guanine966-N2)-methyltransferase
MGKLRITGGILKGRNIALLDDGEARYTSSKVREAIFNLTGDIEGCKVLDLFAGSGSFTIEAMSRGAASATCVEKDRRMAVNLKNNLSRLSIDKDCLVLNMDVRYAVPFLYKSAHNYDIIFMDPPYERGLVAETMTLFKDNALYDGNTVLIVESSKREREDLTLFKEWREITTRQYGDTVVRLFRIVI